MSDFRFENSVGSEMSSRALQDSGIENTKNDRPQIPIITLNDTESPLAEPYSSIRQSTSFECGSPKRLSNGYRSSRVFPGMDEPYPHDCVSFIKLEKPLSPGTVKCEFCPYKSAPSMVKAHQAVHSSEKCFNCRLCKKSFKWIQSLRRHISTVHLGIKKVVCPSCGKSLATKYSLDRHLTAQHKKVTDGVAC